MVGGLVHGAGPTQFVGQ